jgi:hypothetical protein
LSCVAFYDFDPVVFLGFRGGVEGNDDVNPSSRSQEGVDGKVVGHAGVHESQVAFLVDALRTCFWKLTSKAQGEVWDRSRIKGMYLGHILVFACKESVQAASDCASENDWSNFLVVV